MHKPRIEIRTGHLAIVDPVRWRVDFLVMSQSRWWIRLARFRRQRRLRLILHPRLVEALPLAVALRSVELEGLVRSFHGDLVLDGMIDHVLRRGVLLVLGARCVEFVLAAFVLVLLRFVFRLVLAVAIVLTGRLVFERRIVIILVRRSAVVLLLLLVLIVLLRISTGLVLGVEMLLLVLGLTYALIVLALLLLVQLRRLHRWLLVLDLLRFVFSETRVVPVDLLLLLLVLGR